MFLLLSPAAHAGETDQYLTWSIEMRDGAPVYNAYLNDEIKRFLELRNDRKVPIKTKEGIVLSFFGYLFEGLHKSRERHFLFTSPEIERWPRNDKSPWQFQQMSIYRDLAFPFVLPMARSVRMGDIYLGIDKLDHFWGFGRRYYSKLLRLRSQGLSEDEALKEIIEGGLHLESSLVGGVVDGIISYGDLEANFQGMQLARQLAGNTPPCFVRENGKWRFEGTLDVVPYLTPDMDESWNPCLFTGLRRKQVAHRLEEYCATKDGPIVQQRFAAYATYPKSLAMQSMQAEFAEHGDPREKQLLSAICNGNQADEAEKK